MWTQLFQNKWSQAGSAHPHNLKTPSENFDEYSVHMPVEEEHQILSETWILVDLMKVWSFWKYIVITSMWVLQISFLS